MVVVAVATACDTPCSVLVMSLSVLWAPTLSLSLCPAHLPTQGSLTVLALSCYWLMPHGFVVLSFWSLQQNIHGWLLSSNSGVTCWEKPILFTLSLFHPYSLYSTVPCSNCPFIFNKYCWVHVMYQHCTFCRGFSSTRSGYSFCSCTGNVSVWLPTIPHAQVVYTFCSHSSPAPLMLSKYLLNNYIFRYPIVVPHYRIIEVVWSIVDYFFFQKLDFLVPVNWYLCLITEFLERMGLKIILFNYYFIVQDSSLLNPVQEILFPLCQVLVWSRGRILSLELEPGFHVCSWGSWLPHPESAGSFKPYLHT